MRFEMEEFTFKCSNIPFFLSVWVVKCACLPVYFAYLTHLQLQNAMSPASVFRLFPFSLGSFSGFKNSNLKENVGISSSSLLPCLFFLFDEVFPCFWIQTAAKKLFSGGIFCWRHQRAQWNMKHARAIEFVFLWERFLYTSHFLKYFFENVL